MDAVDAVDVVELECPFVELETVAVYSLELVDAGDAVDAVAVVVICHSLFRLEVKWKQS